MIILSKGEYKLRKDEKNSTLLHVQYIGKKEQLCPCCLGKLKLRDTRKRIMRQYKNEIIWLQIHRLKCVECGRLHNELPDCVIPQKHYSFDLIEEALEQHITNQKSVADVENSTISRWYQWFIKLRKKIKDNVCQQRDKIEKCWHYFFISEKDAAIEKIYKVVLNPKDTRKFYLKNLILLLKILSITNQYSSE